MSSNTRVRLTLFCSTATLLFGCVAEKPTRETDPIPVIDTHIHLYDTNRSEGVPWPPTSDKVLYRPVLSQHFDAICEANDVTATVIVEASDRVEDNQWVLDIAKDDPFILGLVGRLEPNDQHFERDLNRFSADPIFQGIRFWGG